MHTISPLAPTPATTESYQEALDGLLGYIQADELGISIGTTGARLAIRYGGTEPSEADGRWEAHEALAAYLLGEPAKLRELTGWTLEDVAPANLGVGTVRARIARRLAWVRALAGLS